MNEIILTTLLLTCFYANPHTHIHVYLYLERLYIYDYSIKYAIVKSNSTDFMV